MAKSKYFTYRVKGAEEKEKVVENFLNFFSHQNDKRSQVSSKTKSSYQKEKDALHYKVEGDVPSLPSLHLLGLVSGQSNP